MFVFPLFFSCKRKVKAQRKLPADVRKLKNVCESRGKRTRRARSASVQKAIPLRAPRPIHPGSNIFSPHSALSGIFLSAFSHRPDGLALRSCRALMRHPGIPTSLPVRFTFLDPASRCGVTRNVHSSQQREERTKKRRRCYRAEAVAVGAIVGGCGTRCAQTVLALIPSQACPLPAR